MKKSRIGKKGGRPPKAEAQAARESLEAYRAAVSPLGSPALDVEGIVRLIREAKREGVAFFEGPGGLKFGFKRDGARPTLNSRPIEDDLIP